MPPVRRRVATCVAALLMLGNARAMAVSLDDPLRLTIPAASLSDALRSLAREADLQILFDPRLVTGLSSAMLDGLMTPRAALAALLRNSLLEAQESGPTAVVIRRAQSTPTLRAAHASSAPNARGEDGSALEEIIVTSQRRVERMRDVPLSLAAYNAEALEERAMRTLDDIAGFTPGVTVTRGRNMNSESTELAIRGIGSGAGAATTGVYIDDTPIQTRHLAFGTFNTYPTLFDIERVEVLRGPQGTLFGASSEGGTMRFITPEPDLYDRALYARAELMDTAHGAAGSEFGVAAGEALIEGRLAARISLSQRRDAGYVDRIDWHRRVVAAADANDAVTRTARIALKWAASDRLTVLPSYFHQQRRLDDSSMYWSRIPGSADPTAGQFDAPLRNGNLIANTGADDFSLWALRLTWDFGASRLTSSTSYFHRRQSAVTDYAEYNRAVFLGNPYPPAGIVAPAWWTDVQRNWTQELRLESSSGARLDWTAGLFVQRAFENTVENVYDPALLQQLQLAGYRDVYVYYQDPFSSLDTQIAVFGQADWRVREHWRLTLGLRFTHARFEGEAFFAGPAVGQPVHSHGRQVDDPVTPRLGLSWTPREQDLFYGSLAKGYRMGGVNAAVGQPCHGGADSALGSIGLSDVPRQYGADSVWSAELGAKLLRAEGRLRVDASLYWIRWENIQQSVPLSACGFQFVANLGQARSRGLDLQAQYRWNEHLLLGGSVGLTDAVFTSTVRLSPEALSLVQKGDHLAASPWSLAAFIEGRRPAANLEAYARVDFQYAARQDSVVSTMNALNGGNPDWFTGIPAQSSTGLRLGLRREQWDIALTAQNLFDRQPRLMVNQDVGLGTSGTPLVHLITARPRTLGLVATYRY